MRPIKPRRPIPNTRYYRHALQTRFYVEREKRKAPPRKKNAARPSWLTLVHDADAS